MSNDTRGSHRLFGFLVVLAPLLAVVATVLSGISIALYRSVLTSQSVVEQSQVELLSKHQEFVQRLLELESNVARFNTQQSAKTSNHSAQSTVRVIRDPIGLSEESLDAELAILESNIKNTYPNSADATHVIALLKAQTRKHDEAQALWRECLRLDPTRDSFYVNIASSAMKQGNYELAVETLKSALASGRKSMDIIYHFAIALSKLGKHDELIELAKPIVDKNPNESAFWSMLGQSYLELDQAEQSESCFRKALQLGESSPSVLVGLGNACMRQEKRDEGAAFLKRYAESKQDTLTGQDRYQTLVTKDLKQTAISILSEAATLQFKNKQYLQAELLLTRCVAIDPSNISTVRALADFYLRTKMRVEERVIRERILELSPTTFNDYLYLAKAHAQLGDQDSAEATLKSAASALPLAAEPLSALAEFCAERGKFEQARWFAQQSLDRFPDVAGFQFLASICKKLKDSQGEAEAIQAAKLLENKK